MQSIEKSLDGMNYVLHAPRRCIACDVEASSIKIDRFRSKTGKPFPRAGAAYAFVCCGVCGLQTDAIQKSIIEKQIPPFTIQNLSPDRLILAPAQTEQGGK